MERTVVEQFRNWYNTGDERMLFLCGGYGVGKTWVVKSFCREFDENYIYISMRGLKDKSSYILSSNAVFIVIDDVNDADALAKACRIMLGIRGDQRLTDYRIIMVSAMVGQGAYEEHMLDKEYVKYVRMYSMSLREFTDEVVNSWEQAGRHKLEAQDILKMYLVVGGMPECVAEFLQSGSFADVRCRQRELICQICGRLANNPEATYTKEGELLESILRQASKDSAGFSLRQVRTTARKREYGEVLDRLELYGMVHKVERFEAVGERAMSYHLYIADVGLANALSMIDERLILEGDKLFTAHNGYIMKAHIVQEYFASTLVEEYELCYWYKQRAKARLPLLLRRKCDNSIVVINIDICDGYSRAKSINSFHKEHREARVVNLSLEDVTSGMRLHRIV